jgi:hypothetical protein
MSTYEALRLFGLDYYATSLDIKAAYRRLATALRPDPAVQDAKQMRAAEERLQMLNRAYAALQDRVGNTPPEIDPIPSGSAGAKDIAQTAGSRVQELLKDAGEWLSQLEFPRVELSRVGRAAGVFVVMAAVGFGVLRGTVAKHFAPTVVDAKTVSAPRVAPVRPAPAAQVAAVEKTSPLPEKKPRRLRSPVLPGVAPEEAKAIGSACLEETGEEADAFRACVLRTAMETPHAIHLD